MNSEENEYIYSQCAEHLLNMRDNLTQKMAGGFFKAEAKAHMKVANRLMELAAAAAVSNKMRIRHINNTIVSIVQDIEDILCWNLKSA